MPKIHWNLEEIYPIKDFEAGLKDATANLNTFSAKLQGLNPEMSESMFNEVIADYEKLTEQLMRLYARAVLWEEVEQQNSEPKFMKSKTNNLLVAFDDQTRVLWLWVKGKTLQGLKELDNKNADRLFKSATKISYLLERERALAKHSLDNFSESILTNKDVFGISTLLDLRSQLDTNITFHLTINGKRRVIKSISELMQLTQAKNPDTREKAYRALYKHYKDNEHKYFAIYEAIVKNWNYEVNLRNYDSAINMRNVKNDITDEVVTTLLDVCKKNAPVFQRFFKLKAKALHVKTLRRFDLYAPFPTTRNEKKYTYNESVKLVGEVLEAFDGDFHQHMQTIIAKEHIDAFPDKQKIGGAFCMTVSNKLAPYVMLNFLGDKRDVLTMAHELGHGIHSILSSDQSILAQDAPLPLAETASTFSETLVFEKLLQESKTKEEKQELIFAKLGDIYATIMRQNYFILFELEAHKMIPAGVRIADLYQAYLNNLQEQFADSVEVDPVFQYEWLYIPHMVNTPFYCYAYSFGELLALSLYNNYKQHGKEYIGKIKAILRAGGSVNAVKLLHEQGIDITKAEFWQTSFDYISGMITELETLMA